MNNPWVNIYANLVRNTAITGKTIEDVPEELRAEVQKILNGTEDGSDLVG